MSNDKNNVSTKSGVGFIGFLQLIFIVLKLTGIISWSWLWVLSPIWISVALYALVIIVLLVLSLIVNGGKNEPQTQIH